MSGIDPTGGRPRTPGGPGGPERSGKTTRDDARPAGEGGAGDDDFAAVLEQLGDGTPGTPGMPGGKAGGAGARSLGTASGMLRRQGLGEGAGRGLADGGGVAGGSGGGTAGAVGGATTGAAASALAASTVALASGAAAGGTTSRLGGTNRLAAGGAGATGGRLAGPALGGKDGKAGGEHRDVGKSTASAGDGAAASEAALQAAGAAGSQPLAPVTLPIDLAKASETTAADRAAALQDLADRVLRAVEVRLPADGSGAREVGLTLDLGKLGEAHVDLARDADGRLAIVFSTTDAATAAKLQDQLPALADRLAERGLPLDSLSLKGADGQPIEVRPTAGDDAARRDAQHQPGGQPGEGRSRNAYLPLADDEEER